MHFHHKKFPNREFCICLCVANAVPFLICSVCRWKSKRIGKCRMINALYSPWNVRNNNKTQQFIVIFIKRNDLTEKMKATRKWWTKEIEKIYCILHWRIGSVSQCHEIFIVQSTPTAFGTSPSVYIEMHQWNSKMLCGNCYPLLEQNGLNSNAFCIWVRCLCVLVAFLSSLAVSTTKTHLKRHKLSVSQSDKFLLLLFRIWFDVYL